MADRHKDLAARLIESGLLQYANAAPPPGLEGRILARLSARRTFRHRVIQGASLVLVVLMVLTGVSQRYAVDHDFSDYHDAAPLTSEAAIAADSEPEQAALVMPDAPPELKPLPAPDASRGAPAAVEEPPLRSGGLIADVRVESLSMSSLQLSSITDLE